MAKTKKSETRSFYFTRSECAALADFFKTESEMTDAELNREVDEPGVHVWISGRSIAFNGYYAYPVGMGFDEPTHGYVAGREDIELKPSVTGELTHVPLDQSYESFVVTEVRPDGTMLGRSSDGKEREVFLTFNRRLSDNSLFLAVGRQYRAGEGWPEDEREADEG